MPLLVRLQEIPAERVGDLHRLGKTHPPRTGPVLRLHQRGTASIIQNKKFEKLTHLLDTLAFNQMIIFVNRVDRAKKLTELLRQKLFNPICIHSQLKQEERIKNYDLFKANGSRLLVATDLFGRGIDIERVNLVINYGKSPITPDFPTERDTYLHRVGRAGRFGTKGLAINFIKADEEES